MATGFASNKFYCPCRQRVFFIAETLESSNHRDIKNKFFKFSQCLPGSRLAIFINREARLQNINNKHTERTAEAQFGFISLKTSQSYVEAIHSHRLLLILKLCGLARRTKNLSLSEEIHNNKAHIPWDKSKSTCCVNSTGSYY